MVELAKTEGIPPYIKIREKLREDIAHAVLKRGEKLPAEHKLASEFKVSRMTVRKSIEDLMDEGLLYRKHGVGTFVAFPHLERDHTRLTSFFDKANNDGVRARASILTLEVVSANQKVAKALDIPVGDRAIRVKTLRYADDTPITVHDAYIPRKIFGEPLDKNLDFQHLWTLFESHGYKVKRAIQHVEARGATKDLARLMEIKEGAPILFKERTIYAEDGTPLEFTYCYNRGDIYSLTVSLER